MIPTAPYTVPMRYKDLQDARKTLGLSTEAFCRLIGISPGTYYSWSDPKNVPKGSTERLVELFLADPREVTARLLRLENDADEKV